MSSFDEMESQLVPEALNSIFSLKSVSVEESFVLFSVSMPVPHLPDLVCSCREL